MENEEIVVEGQDPIVEDPAAEPVIPENMIPKQRFDQVNNQFRAYKEFGTTEQLKADREELIKYRQAIKDYNTNKNAQDPKVAVRNQLLDVYPELSKINDFDKMQTRVQDQNFDIASDTFGSILKDQKMTVEPKYQDFLETYLWHNMSKEQQDTLKTGSPRQIRETVKEVYQEFKDAEPFKLLKNQSSNIPPKPPIRHGAGGTPPGKTGAKPLTHDEIINQGFARLQNKG